MARSTPLVAVGPLMPGWGSWDWVGTFLVEELRGPFRTTTFEAGQVPDADIVVVVKHAPTPAWVAEVRRRAAIVYCPIDRYGDRREIDTDAAWLRQCARIVVHCQRLQSYFAAIAETSYLDHPIKFATPTRSSLRKEGNLLWVGVRSNLPPLVVWVNAHPLPAPLDVLTNPEHPGRVPSADELGFASKQPVRIHEWTPARHLEFTRNARAALDIKGEDFRSRHKPPAKALDFIASGLPLALNPGSSPAEHLANLGLKVPSPLDAERWLSEAYWNETRRFGERLSRELTPRRIAEQFQKLLGFLPLPVSRAQSVPVAGRSDPRIQEREVPPAEKQDTEQRYRVARDLALTSEHEKARSALVLLDEDATEPRIRALVKNDLAVLAMQAGDPEAARETLKAALAINPSCTTAHANLATLASSFTSDTISRSPQPVPDRVSSNVAANTETTRVAVVSLLFNWPSTGGGNVHSAELTLFLARAGYDVRHFSAKFDPWGIGRITEPTPFPVQPVEFSPAQWSAAGITAAFRRVIEEYDPHWVILTDSWNLKPILVEAAGGRPTILRLQALECLCPLNNVRLLPIHGDKPRQCNRHQLATPGECERCIREFEHTSGDLHRAERTLAGVGTPEYRQTLFRAFAEASTVLVVNPLTAAMVEPYARDVRVVTAGMDPARFPWPYPAEQRVPGSSGRLKILFAGLTREWMKGFHILHEACRRLWANRQDFEVVATDEPPEEGSEPWFRYVGWQSQKDLPGHLASADIVVVPTVAQEALGRTAVEAMAAGKPVVASRLGGLPFTVIDGATGLLCEPSNPRDLAAKLAMLLDDVALRDRLGIAGRKRFEEHYSWPAIVERHYQPLLGNPIRVTRPR